MNDKRIIAVQLVANRGPGLACLQQQHQPRPACVIGTPAAACRSLLEFHTFRVRQYEGVFHEPNRTTASSVTVY
jgi:hypothetical protein